MNRLFSITILVLLAACNSNTAKNEKVVKAGENPDAPVMTFYEDKVDLGTIKQGEIAQGTFKFKNTGKSDLIIRSVDGGCGCTSTKWEPEPIKPGKDSEIKIVFNSTGKSIGKHSRDVRIASNASDEDYKVRFTCQIVSPNK